jgi:tetratricopeptide (TPR) repeat protein
MSIFENLKLLKQKPSEYVFIPIKNALQPYLILFFASFFIYANTLNHEVAYDDETVIHKNEFVIKGISGIKDILTHDSYYSYYKQLGRENSLPGGRYRPLSHITFAIEQEFIGTIPDGIVKENSWDVNGNFIRDQFEDVNKDGLFTDYDFWVKGSGMRHFINVLIYALLVVLIYHVLMNFVFPNSKDMVFFCCLLFSFHPLHTEVVANIKSRDEILSMLFIFSSIYYSFKYINDRNRKQLIFLGISMLLALLSKEYAVFLFILIPCIFYVFKNDVIDIKDKNLWIIVLLVLIAAIALIKFFNSGTLVAAPFLFLYGGYYFAKKNTLPINKIMYVLGAALIAYLSLRFSATTHQVYNSEEFKADIIGNPYLYATPSQEWASKIAIWLKYLALFIIPNPLISDYSYNSIPYSDFAQPKVWLTLFIFVSAIIAAFYFTLKRNPWSLGFVFFLLFFFPVSNLVVDIGATMGERLFFHASLGLSLLIAMIVIKILKRLEKKSRSMMLLTLSIFGIQQVIYATFTIKRNPDWKNNSTLFIHDIKYAPENVNMLLGSGLAYYELGTIPENKSKKNEYLKLSITQYEKGIKIYPSYFSFYVNKSISHFYLNEIDKAIACTDTMIKLSPNTPVIYRIRKKISEKIMLDAIQLFEKGDKKIALQQLVKSLAVDKNNEKAWNNMAKALFEIGAIDKSIACYQSALKINPKSQIAMDGLKKIENIKKSIK